MKKVFFVCLVFIFAIGCASAPLKISNVDNMQNYKELGNGKGSSVGIMLFNFIPIGQNQRFTRAYNAAVDSKGGDLLVDPVIREKWFWAYILNGYITSIEGTVVKKK